MDEDKSLLIGRKIRQLRKEKGLSQSELGKLLGGLKQGSIGDIENGKSKLSKMDIVDRILDVFEIEFDYLFRDSLTVFDDKGDVLHMIEKELGTMNSQQLDLTNDLINIYITYLEQSHK